MKKLSWVHLILGGLLVAAMGYLLWWSLTGLVDKLEGPAFAGQSDASVWVPLHPAFVSFARWYIPVVAVFALGVLVLGIIQVRRPKNDLNHPAIIQTALGCVIALSAFIILLAVKPNQWVLSSGQGARMLDMAASMWKAPYAVLDFGVIVLGIAVAGVAIALQTLASREEAPLVTKPGWKSARSAARRRR
jgi:hypothetical protein